MNITEVFREEVSRIQPEVQKQVDLSFAISDKLDAILQERNMTQKQLARMVGCSEADVCKWLGGTHNFTLKTLARISVALDVDLIHV